MKKTEVERVQVSAPNLKTIKAKIKGTAPFMQARFAAKALAAMKEKQEAGSTAKKGKARAARDFDSDYEGAFHRDVQGRCGIPCSAFRNAMIDACRMVGAKMTYAKMSVFVLPDTFDVIDGTPLVLLEGNPERSEMGVRNATGVMDIRVRPMWREWSATVTVRYDADQFTGEDVANLLLRAGMQVGVGEGRPFGRMGCGMGFGTFEIVQG